MAHLLMIESWVGATGYLIPRAIARLGHRFTFVARDLHYYLKKPPPSGLHPLLDAENILTTETNDTPALLDFLAREHEALRFDGVVTGCDYYLNTAAEVAAGLGLPGSTPAALDQTRLKHRMREALEQAGLPNPAFRIVTSWDEARRAAAEISYPLVLKPVDLCSGMFVSFADGEAQLVAAFERLGGFPLNNRKQPRPPQVLLEAYMAGEEVSVEAVTFEGATEIIGITDKSLDGFPHFIESGHMFPAALEPDRAEATCDLVRRALAAVGYVHGASHTEVKLTPDGPRIVEINARAGGNYISELIQLVHGIDPLEAVVRLALGERPAIRPVETGVRSAAIRFILPPRAGLVGAVRGVEALDGDPNVVRWTLKPVVGTELPVARDNNEYLGHVVTVDRDGLGARGAAERAAARIELELADVPAPAAVR